MQRLINVNMWGIEPSLLHCQHLEISEELDRGQEVEWTASTNRFGGAVHGLTIRDFDCLRPSISFTLSGASNVMAAASAKFGQKRIYHF